LAHREVLASAAEDALEPTAGCYTTARFEGGRVRHGTRIARRLVRDAARLGLPPLDEASCLRALRALGEAAFGAGAGIVRLSASAAGDGRLRLVGTARPLGPERPAWHAGRARTLHPGPDAFSGTKRAGPTWLEAARAERAAGGVDELLLFDAAGRLVEGTRTTPIVVGGDGCAVTPPLARGGVAGVAREILLDRVPELSECDVDAAALAAARELVAVNAVRGARAVAWFDGAPLGGGRPGPLAARLAAALDAED
jgi:branched-subunit amino acid aminotransferase/4-amino-4-deoxychorismate lyase